MHLLVVISKQGTEYQFFFKDKQKAEKFKKDFRAIPREPGNYFAIVDEYQKEGEWEIGLIGGVILIDLDGKIETEIQTQLIAARAQARLENAAKTDPVLQGMRNLVPMR